MATRSAVVLVSLLLTGRAAAAPPDRMPAATTQEGPVIQNGSTVKFEYTLTDEHGTLLDTNRGKEPLTYVHGEGQIVVGLEKALTGLHPGDQRTVTVPPAEAYGPVKPLIEVPKEKVPLRSRVAGATFMVRTRNSDRPFPVQVKEVKDTTIVLDANHPLAGKTLVFDVKILSVEPPPTASR
jgi:FKBP-type peptidyl-prolyl cis-trans isomerase 2